MPLAKIQNRVLLTCFQIISVKHVMWCCFSITRRNLTSLLHYAHSCSSSFRTVFLRLTVLSDYLPMGLFATFLGIHLNQCPQFEQYSPLCGPVVRISIAARLSQYSHFAVMILPDLPTLFLWTTSRTRTPKGTCAYLSNLALLRVALPSVRIAASLRVPYRERETAEYRYVGRAPQYRDRQRECRSLHNMATPNFLAA